MNEGQTRTIATTFTLGKQRVKEETCMCGYGGGGGGGM